MLVSEGGKGCPHLSPAPYLCSTTKEQIPTWQTEGSAVGMGPAGAWDH